jgi:hypothetical protein
MLSGIEGRPDRGRVGHWFAARDMRRRGRRVGDRPASYLGPVDRTSFAWRTLFDYLVGNREQRRRLTIPRAVYFNLECDG